MMFYTLTYRLNGIKVVDIGIEYGDVMAIIWHALSCGATSVEVRNA